MSSRINMGPDGGPYIAINENSGNIELEDNTGTTVAIWDDANSQWDFQNNPISNVDSLTSNSVNTEQTHITEAEQASYTVQSRSDKQLLNFELPVTQSGEDLLRLKNQDRGHAMIWAYVGNNDPPSHKVMTVNSYFADSHYSVIDSFRKDNFHNQIADPAWDSNNREWTISSTGDDTVSGGTAFITILTNCEVERL